MIYLEQMGFRKAMLKHLTGDKYSHKCDFDEHAAYVFLRGSAWKTHASSTCSKTAHHRRVTAHLKHDSTKYTSTYLYHI